MVAAEGKKLREGALCQWLGERENERVWEKEKLTVVQDRVAGVENENLSGVA